VVANPDAHVQAQEVMTSTLQRLEDLESCVSLVSSGRLSSSSTAPDGRTLDAGIEAALHMLERLLVSMQCLAADAATISNASNACKVEELVSGIMQGLETAAEQGAGMPGAAASLVVLRNAAGTAGKQRCQELERQLSALQLQLADTMSQLVSASSANARLQRMLNLKTRALASLERQLGAVESQRLQAAQASSNSTLAQLQGDLAEARLQQAKLAADRISHAGELQAAQSRTSSAEAALEHMQAAAAATEACTVQLTERLEQAMEVSRHAAVAAAAAQGQHAAAALKAEQLQQQLTAAGTRVEALEREVRECRHRVDICSQAARDAEYRAVETTTMLADVRRELDFSQLLLQKQIQQQQQPCQATPTAAS
jgi:chromosome segregation ATPase